MAENILVGNILKGKKNNVRLAKEIVKRLTDKANTIAHGRHIGFDEAVGIFGDGVEALENDQDIQDAILTVHHSTIIMLDSTSASKIIESHTGRAFVKQVQLQAVQVPSPQP